MVAAEKMSLEMGESTTLNCTASNGVPESQVSWIKNGQYLINATSITIPVNNAFNDGSVLPFGEYTCVVHNDFYTSLHPSLIQENGMLLTYYEQFIVVLCVQYYYALVDLYLTHSRMCVSN